VDFGSLVERGTNAPSFETIGRICSSLGVTEAELFTLPADTAVVEKRGRVKKNDDREKPEPEANSKRRAVRD